MVRRALVRAGFLLCALAGVTAWCAQPSEGMTLLQPDYLSAAADTPLILKTRLQTGGEARLRVTLVSQDALVRVEAVDQTVTLEPGPSSLRCVIRAEKLASMNLFEDVAVAASLEVGARVFRSEADATLLPEAAPPGVSAWGFSYAAKPAMVYTSKNAPLVFALSNPAGSAKSVKIQLAFKNSAGQTPVSMSAKAVAAPGASTVTVTVPSTTTTQARAKGATILKASLKLDGVVKAKDTATLDYDLAASGSANPGSGNLPLAVAFTGSAVGGQAPYTYRWDFGDGAGSSSQNATHTYTVEGAYAARFTVTDSLGGSVSATSAVTVTVPPLAATCTASPTSGLAPLLVSFSASAAGGTGAYEYDWNFGDGSAHGTTATAAHSYAAAGTYTATLTVTSGSQSKQCTQTISVSGSSMTLTCSANPATGIAPLTVTFAVTATGGPSSYAYHWDFGDGNTSTVQNPTHSYPTPGLYHAVVTVTSGSQTAQCQKDVSVTQKLTVGCEATPTSGPAPLSVFFKVWAAGGDGLYTFVWAFGDGTGSTHFEPNHVYTAAGTYTATVTVASGGQTQTCSQAITVQ